jgi:hypothetical protein
VQDTVVANQGVEEHVVGKPERTILMIGATVLALVAVAVIIVLAFGSPDVEEFPADTPEGSVQRYLAAVHAGDDEAAAALVTERALSEMGGSAYPNRFHCPSPEGRRVRVARVERGEQRSTVYLSIQQTTGSGLSLDRSSWEYSVRLVLDDGVWKIEDPYFCV